MPLDLTIFPLYRINGRELGSLPGLLALTPPSNAARGRERERLIVYLLLTGNATFSTSEYLEVAQDAADMYYQTPGAMTTALRAASEMVNATLLNRNMKTTPQGQYAMGWLTLAALRDSQCTLSLSGPMHAFWFGANETRHIHEPVTSGKGLGAAHSASVYYAQVNLSAGDKLLFFGRAPNEWGEALKDSQRSSLEAMRRKLVTTTTADLNAALIQASEGTGLMRIFHPAEEMQAADSTPQAESTPAPAAQEGPPAHLVQPAVFSPPPADSRPQTASARNFPSSIPRLNKPAAEQLAPPPVAELQPEAEEEESQPQPPRPAPSPRRVREKREPSEQTRKLARNTAAFIQWSRRVSDAFSEKFGALVPRLLPTTEAQDPQKVSNTAMFFIAVLIPLMVVTVAIVFYMRYGRSQQYELYLAQAKEMQMQALALSDPVAQRRSWEAMLLNLDLAESYRETSETITLRQQAEANLDQLLGVLRMNFSPAFSSNLGIQISRMAANDLELFMLNAETGDVLRARQTGNGRGFDIDTSFLCRPGQYESITVGPLVDILAMPGLNFSNASLLGIDASGNLLYCAAGQVPRAIPLPPPDTNWNRVTAFTIDNGNLYVLDANARAVWVYAGRDGSFIDRPYFFFGGQTPEKQDVIDIAVMGDELFMLHSDGHLSTCSYSRIQSKPTRCEDPAALINPFPAYQGVDLFAGAHFTQLMFNAPPDSSLLALDSDSQGVLRFSLRELELLNQLRPSTRSDQRIPAGVVSAMTVSPNHVLYFAVDGQVYFAANMP